MKTSNYLLSMGRLIKRVTGGIIVPKSPQLAYEKLAYYEDLEEQDLLLKLPCRVGDVVYVVGTLCLSNLIEEQYCISCDDCIYNDTLIVFSRTVDVNLLSIIIFNTNELFIFGETVFLTKEQAEQKLKSLININKNTVGCESCGEDMRCILFNRKCDGCYVYDDDN